MTIPRYSSIAALALVLASLAMAQDEDAALPTEQTVPVADAGEEAGSATAATTAQEPDEEQLLAAFAAFREYLAERNFDEADKAAKRVVELAIRLHGAQSHETSKALNNLALVQHANKQYDAAAQNFTSAIEILEYLEDRLNGQLVNPLRGLGASQLGLGRPDLARQSFQRATHITHVNEGPHNIEQVEILESLAEATVRVGDVEGARDVLDRIHVLNVRHFKDDALGLLPSLMRRGGWQHRAGYYNDERATYRRAIRIIETSVGKNDSRLVEPLVKLGESFYFYEPLTDGVRGTSGATGETYFKRAVRIAEASEEYPWLELAQTRLALADYYAYAEAHNRARKIYLEVWNSLSSNPDRLEMRRDLLEAPIALRSEPLPRYAGGGGSPTTPDGDFLTGSVKVDYTVSTRGRVRNLRTGVDPIEFTDMQRMVHREIRRRMHRPQLVEGVPVESGNQVFEHTFFYRQAELEELKKKKALASQSAQQKRQ